MTTIDRTYAVNATVQAARIRDILNATWHGRPDQIPEWVHEGVRTGLLHLDLVDGLFLDLQLQDPDHWLVKGVTGLVFTTTDQNFRTTYKPAQIVHNASVDNQVPCCGQPLFDILDRGEMTSTDTDRVNCTGKNQTNAAPVEEVAAQSLADAGFDETDTANAVAALATCTADLSSGSPAADPSSGAALIAAERLRQVEVEGWTPERDAQRHSGGELVQAAGCYLNAPNFSDQVRYAMMRVHGRDVGEPWSPVEWPWPARFWKPTPHDRVRELVKAGALIAAEIDRLVAAAGKRPWTPDEKIEGGGTRITVKRCCNGCGRQLGDVTDAEMDATIEGRPLPDVRAECGCLVSDGADSAVAEPSGPETPAEPFTGASGDLGRLVAALRAEAEAPVGACTAIPGMLSRLAGRLEAGE